MIYSCIQCGTVQESDKKTVVFKTAFVRRNGQDTHAGICKSCAGRVSGMKHLVQSL